MKFLQRLFELLFLIVLTVPTQIGGAIYLLSLPLFRWIDRQKFNKWPARGYKILAFLTVYLICTIAIVPAIAPVLGRKPLPYLRDAALKPMTLWTCILNRHYVRPELYDAAHSVAQQIQQKYPGTYLAYLDANFPFWNGFPLLPHLSHDDGKKLDLAFFYVDQDTANKLNNKPTSFMGYGVFEAPKVGETDQAAICARKGYWQYSILGHLVLPLTDADLKFDAQRTKAMVQCFAKDQRIGKIFIEPHLKTRLGLRTGKVRYHGCHAVRHDDHLHVQLR